MKHTRQDLKIMQGWSLERKIRVTQTRIMEWYMRYDGQVFISFSGGKDSTVLLDLAVIESSLDEWARSAAKACGMWQFMEGTGREYGLEVNANVDERFNLEKATRAACRYLKDAYARYGDWLTVAASYNAGQGRISRELERQGVDCAADLWLNPETSRYMFRLLAVKEVFSNPKRFGFCLKRHQLYPPVKYRYVEVDTAIHSLAGFAREQKVLLRQLKEANPWLRDYTLHNRSRKLYRIAVPDSASIYYNPQSTPVHDTAWVID